MFERPSAALLDTDTQLSLLVHAFEEQIACTTENGTRRATAIAEAHRALLRYQYGYRERALRQLGKVTDTLKKLNLSVLLAEQAIIEAAAAGDRALAEGSQRTEGALWKEGTLALEAAEAALRSQRYAQAVSQARVARACFENAVRANRRANTDISGLNDQSQRSQD
jgi:hypothetical protein